MKNSVLRQTINAVLPQNTIEFKTLAFPSMKRKDVNENIQGLLPSIQGQETLKGGDGQWGLSGLRAVG